MRQKTRNDANIVVTVVNLQDCRFAHNEEELQPRPDGSWDPTSKKGKEMARKEGGEESEEGDGDGDDEKSVSVMMTGIMDENGDSQFSKCVIHMSMKWNSDKFKTFLDELRPCERRPTLPQIMTETLPLGEILGNCPCSKCNGGQQPRP